MEHLNPKKAHEVIQNNPNTLLIDCRTEVEFFYVGHPSMPSTSSGTRRLTSTSTRTSPTRFCAWPGARTGRSS
jgi:hypothetical protein